MINAQLAEQARHDMWNFVQELPPIIHSVIEEPEDENGQLLLLAEMLPELRAAWTEFSEDWDWSDGEKRIFGTSAAVLQSHGLYGAQLKAKLSLFRTRLGRFSTLRRVKTLLWLFDSGNTVLDSIIQATGLHGALRELKDVVRNSVDDG